MTDQPLSVEGLRKEFPNCVAVSDLSFEVRSGEILGVVGPNGAGKTTILRVVAGILPPDAGSISICGFDLAKQTIQAKQNLAFVPDAPTPFPYLTVYEHLQLTAGLYRVPEFQKRADELLERFELAHKRNALAGELSRGMKKKLSICCAYLHEPKLILMDEPVTGLDPVAIHTMVRSLRDEVNRGAGILVTSHLLGLVERISDRILIIHEGRRVMMGTIEELRRQTPLLKTGTLEQIFMRAVHEKTDG